MPLQTYDTQINSVCQPFTLVSTSSDPKTLKSVYSFESNRQTSDVICPFCRKKNVYAHARHSTKTFTNIRTICNSTLNNSIKFRRS